MPKIGLGFLALLFLASSCASTAYKPGLRTAPEPDRAIRHSERRVPVAEKIELLTQAWAPKSETRAILVIVHGLKDYSDRYARLAMRLAKEGIEVRAFDLRGHGDSSGDRVWVDSFEDYIDDLEVVLSQALKDAGKTPVFVYGHSMGGAIVVRHYLERKPAISGLILSAPALKRGANVSGFLAGTAKILGTITPTLAVLDLKDEDFSRDPAVVASMKTDPLVYDSNGPARTGKELLKTIEWIQENMGAMDAPFLTMHGTEDRVTNPEGSQELVSRAKSADKTLKLFDGYFHDLLHEPGYDQVESEVTSWILARASSARRR